MALDKTKKISAEKFEVTFLETGIVENHFKAGAILEVEDITALKKYNFELAGNKPYAVLVTAGELSSLTKDARELAASKEFIDHALAKGIVIASIGQKIIGNFYLRVNKPYLQTKLFADREKALSWLRTFIKG